MNIIKVNELAFNLDNMTQINIQDATRLPNNGEYEPSATYVFALQITFIGDEHSTRISVNPQCTGIEEYQRVKEYTQHQFFIDVQKGGILDLNERFTDAKRGELDKISKSLENINL